MNKTRRNEQGFTLLEILLVVAAIAILTGIVIVALNPGKQLGDTRDAQRRSDVNTILNAVYQYSIDNNGNFPSGIATGTAQQLGTVGTGCDSGCGATTTIAACVDLTSDLVATYTVGIPLDPQSGTNSETDYYITQTSSGRLVVGACDPEEASSIEVTR